ncbi:MAG: hypothetical protein U0835_02045 [Isosphaeraceae bacterium]
MSTPPNSDIPEPFEIPNPFGRGSTILRKRSQGGMGSVYLPRTPLSCRVALKILRELAGSDPDTIARVPDARPRSSRRSSTRTSAGFLDVGEFEEASPTMEYHEGNPRRRAHPGKAR